jgi:hypothetical protein
MHMMAIVNKFPHGIRYHYPKPNYVAGKIVQIGRSKITLVSAIMLYDVASAHEGYGNWD